MSKQLYTVRVSSLALAVATLESAKAQAESFKEKHGRIESWHERSIEQCAANVARLEALPESLRTKLHTGGRGNGAVGGLYTEGQLKRILGRYPKGGAEAVPVALGVKEPGEAPKEDVLRLPEEAAVGLLWPELNGHYEESTGPVAKLLGIHEDDVMEGLLDLEESGGKHDCTDHYGFLPLALTADGGIKGYHLNYTTSYNDGLQDIIVTGPVVRRTAPVVTIGVTYGKP